MARLWAALIGVLIALACSQVASAAVSVPEAATSAGTYVYDGEFMTMPFAGTGPERGPPAARFSDTTYDTTGYRSRDAATRPSGAATRPTYAYDGPTEHTQVARDGGPTPARVKCDLGTLGA